MATSPYALRSLRTGEPPVAGMPVELWTWLREASPVRPGVVADVRAALATGERPTADQVARAILGAPGRHAA